MKIPSDQTQSVRFLISVDGGFFKFYLSVLTWSVLTQSYFYTTYFLFFIVILVMLLLSYGYVAQQQSKSHVNWIKNAYW